MTAQAGGASPLSSMMTLAERESLRREMRARRRSLTREEREHAARQIARIADRARLLKADRRIAVYVAHGAEAGLAPLISAARRRGCILYLPVITHYRTGRMSFRRFDPGEKLRANRYGILEPERGRSLPAVRLDLVLAPLAAFDDRGSRLGSGAGFYDRALRRLRSHRRWRRPRIIGVGYAFQRVAKLQSAPWDVPLDGVLTEQGFLKMLSRPRDDT